MVLINGPKSFGRIQNSNRILTFLNIKFYEHTKSIIKIQLSSHRHQLHHENNLFENEQFEFFKRNKLKYYLLASQSNGLKIH